MLKEKNTVEWRTREMMLAKVLCKSVLSKKWEMKTVENLTDTTGVVGKERTSKGDFHQ